MVTIRVHLRDKLRSLRAAERLLIVRMRAVTVNPPEGLSPAQYVPPVHHGEFHHPLLVEVYDAECPWSRDDDFFMAVIAEAAAPGRRVLDLGCGTGRLALGLAAAGYAVTGVDPAGPSLTAARRKPGAERVTWIEGTSSVLPPAAFDAAVMTSHVAQFFVADDEWQDVLTDLHRALVPGGVLTFDSRDPDARAWERWNPVDWRRGVTLASGETVDIWTEVTNVDEATCTVSFTHHYGFARSGDELVSTATLRFRSEQDIRRALSDTGFHVEHVFGGWDRQPVGHADGELLVVARRQ